MALEPTTPAQEVVNEDGLRDNNLIPPPDTMVEAANQAEEGQQQQQPTEPQQQQQQQPQQQQPQETPQPKEDDKPLQVEVKPDENTFNLLNEAAAVLGGGAVDAVESVGGFAELTGDTLKTGLSHLFGNYDASQDPFSDKYLHGDGDWLNIPDKIHDAEGNVLWEDAQPQTGLGRFGRGLVEFGLLSWATAGVGGAAFGGARIGARTLAMARAAGVGAKGSRYIKFIQTGVKIGSEGAIADLISSSSEHANIMNLANDNIPWAVPVIGEMFSVKPEDNPWTARFKSIAAGAGLNYVGHALGALSKGFWEAGRARIAGKSVDEANVIGNEAAANDFARSVELDEAAATEMALDRYQQGYGISRAEPLDEYMRTKLDPARYDEWVTWSRSQVDEDAVKAQEIRAEADSNAVDDVFDDDLGTYPSRAAQDEVRELDPFVNNDRYTVSEQATYRTEEGAVGSHIREAVNDMKAGGEGRGYTPIVSESYLNAMSRGDVNLRQYIEEVADNITNEAFKDVDNKLSWADTKTLVLRQANDLLEMLENGGDISATFKAALDDPDHFRVYGEGPGNTIRTISPTQKAANVLVMNALAKQVQGIATGALSIADDMPIGRQAEMIFDSMEVLLKENKKMGMMWGLDGKAQQQYTLSPTLKRAQERNLKTVDTEVTEYMNALRTLIKDQRWDELEDLMELHALSGGKVRTLDHIHEYLKAVWRGGRMDDIHIKGRVRKELQGTFFNSVLSSLKTPIKAIGGTNMIAMLRPLQAWMGAAMRGNDKEMFIAAAQMDGLFKASSEAIEMARYNWDLGVQRKGQSYQGKFDVEADFQDWKQLKPFYEKYGTQSQKNAYGFLDKVVDFNTSPFVKYSVNAMGAGDAAARTMIGRQYMRLRAAEAAWNLNGNTATGTEDLMNLVRRSEESFRDEIFKLDKNGRYIVSEKGASMAGDEAAMTRALQENFKGFELISNIPGMKAFFPFVRTGFNYLDVTFKHTPLALFSDKYKDLTQFKVPRNLDKYGIRPEDVAYEVALMEGRMAMGTAIMSLAVGAALSGKMTGDMPLDKKDADNWRKNKIQPKSFKFGDTYVSYQNLEVFNTLFSLTANVVGNSNLLGEKMTDDWIKKLTYMTSAVVVDQSMLAGVEDLARLMNPRSAEDLLKRSGSKYLRSHLPYAGLLAQIGDITDANRKEAETFLELLIQRDALFKSAILPAKYDVLNKDRSGKPIIYGPEQPLMRLFNSLSPIAVTHAGDDPVKKMLKYVRYDMSREIGTFKGEPLNSYEKSKIQQALSKGNLRRDLELLMKVPKFKRLIEEYEKKGLKESDGYKLTDQEFYNAIQSIFRKHKQSAMEQVLLNNPILSERVKLRQAKKVVGKTGSYANQPVDIKEGQRKLAEYFAGNSFPK